MKYRELLDEYMALLEQDMKLDQEIHTLPKGYLVTKRIAGKEYLYLQYSVFGKKKSEYIPEAQAARIKAAITRREPAAEEKEAIQRELARLEAAAKILDSNLSRTFFFLKQCTQMDALALEKRQEALSFAQAMTALEGLSSKAETEDNLQLWARGEKRFSDFYMKSLQSYRVLEGMQ